MRAKRWKRCWSPAKSNGTGSRQWRMLSRPEKVTEPVTLFWQKGLLFGQKEANNAPRFRWMFKIADFGETASLCSVSPDLLRPLQLPAAVRPNVSGCCHPEPVRHASEEGRAIGGSLHASISQCGLASMRPPACTPFVPCRRRPGPRRPCVRQRGVRCRSFSARWICRSASRFAIVSRLSYSFLPLATPISSFANPFRK